MVAFDGPEVCVQPYDEIVPSGSLADPVRLVLFTGKVMVMLLPAETVGGWLMIGAELTVTVTVAEVAAPLLSVTVSL